MLAIESGGPRPAHRHGPGTAGMAGRRIVALALLALGVWAVLNQEAFRAGEAQVVAWSLADVLGVGSLAIPGEPVFLVQDDVGWAGLRITLECTVLLFLAPVVLAAASTLSGRRVPAHRVLAATVAVVVLLAAANLVRCVMISLAMRQWGAAGYHWSHVFAGSVLMLAAAFAAVLLFVRLGFFGRAGRRRPGVTP